MTGTLGLFSLVDLFQLLASSARSGRLTVDHPRGTARVFFEDGRVVHAEFGEASGEEAVYALFADEQGSFEFMLGLPSPQRTIEATTENLVLEATRRLDESRRSGARTVELDAVPSFAEDGGTKVGDLGLSRSEVAMLRLVDGRRSVEAIARAASVAPEEAQLTLQRLIDVGVLRFAGRRPRTARLVTRLAEGIVPHGTAGVDPSILESWSKALGHRAESVACRRPDGRVCMLAVAAVPQAGPYLVVGRETLMRTGLVVNQALLVRPVPAAGTGR